MRQSTIRSSSVTPSQLPSLTLSRRGDNSHCPLITHLFICRASHTAWHPVGIQYTPVEETHHWTLNISIQKWIKHHVIIEKLPLVSSLWSRREKQTDMIGELEKSSGWKPRHGHSDLNSGKSLHPSKLPFLSLWNKRTRPHVLWRLESCAILSFNSCPKWCHC